VTSRPLHAVQFPPSAGERMLAALAAALDGSGPAILPLDPELPEAALARALAAFAPDAIETAAGTRALPPRPPGSAGGGSSGGGSSDGGSPAVLAADTAVVIATSGSTGVPKGVQLSAAALTASAAASLRRIGAGPGDRWLCCLPTFHISGIGVLVRSMLTGTEPVLAASASPAVLAASGCAHVSLVPTQLRRLLDAGCGPGVVQTVLLGGAAAAGGLLAEARAGGWRVITTYGMSETCGGCVYDGVPLDGVRVRLGQESGQDAGDNLGQRAGRIEIGGPVLFSGYLGQPDLTAAVLRNGWFTTSDLGHWQADGRLEVRGRADDVINTGGEKVVPGEVEAVLGTCQGVADVVVVGLPDSDWGEAVTAFVVAADPAAPPELDQLRSDVRAAISAYAAPRRLVFVPEFPLLPSGKPDRAALRRIGAERA
jgi:O-succinylbenzoic acid--CoA ligase